MRRRLLTAWSARRARTGDHRHREFSQARDRAHIGDQPRRASRSSTRHRPIDRRIPDARPTGSARSVWCLRRFDLRAPARRSPDRRVSTIVADAGPARAARDRRREPDASSAASISRRSRRRRTHADRITFRSYVDDATLAALYRRASVFAFLSEYEGFGLTPLEALAHGVPPVVLDTPVARETYGPAARYVAPAAADRQIADAHRRPAERPPAARRACCAHAGACCRDTTGTRGRRHARGPRGGRRCPIGPASRSSSSPTTRARRSTRCLESLVGHTEPFPTTITVVDNASTDGTADAVRRALAVGAGDRGRRQPRVRAANNLGIRATTASTCCC